MLPAYVIEHLQNRLDEPIETDLCRQLHGSSLNTLWFVKSQRHEYFLKTNEASYAQMMAAEYEGLIELDRADTSARERVIRRTGGQSGAH